MVGKKSNARPVKLFSCKMRKTNKVKQPTKYKEKEISQLMRSRAPRCFPHFCCPWMFGFAFG